MRSKFLRVFSFIMVMTMLLGLLPAVAAEGEGVWVPIVEDDFDNFSDNGWGALGDGKISTPKETVAVFSTSENLDTGITNIISGLDSEEKIKIAFDARIDTYTDGHSTSTKSADNASLAMKVSLNGARIMFAIEKNHIDCSNGGTWSGDIALDENTYSTSVWQHYELVYVKSTGKFDVYVNGTKVGEGTKQTHTNTKTSGLSFWANGDENNTALSYMDNLVVYLPSGDDWRVAFKDDFDNLTDGSWGKINGNAVSQVYTEKMILGDSALVLETKANLETGLTLSNSAFSAADSIKVSFDAKVESFTDGHQATTALDNATLAMMLYLDKARFMFAIEDDHIDTSSAAGTWANDIMLDASKYNTATWQHYELVYKKSADVVEVYVNGTKVGEGGLQKRSDSRSTLDIWCNGDENNHAKSYLDNLKIETLSGSTWTTAVEDSFDNLSANKWSNKAGNSTYPVYVAPVRPIESALELSADEFVDNGARLGLDVSTYDKFKISFKGKINQYTTGHGTPDCTTLGVNVGLGGRRIMFAVEKDHIDLSTTGGTWAKDITLDAAKFNTSDWQTYDIVYDKATQTVDVYVNGELVGSGASQTRNNTGTYIQFWTHGYDANNASNAYVDDFSVSYWQLSGLPSWETGAKLSVTKNDGGFTLNWPAAENATSYDVTVGGVTANVTTTSYTATGIDLVNGGYNVSVVAKNDKGVSPSTLTTIANPKFDPEVHTMDVEKILVGNTSGGDGKYSHYRIPGIVVTKQDTVIMYFEARTGLDDWSPMDLLIYRSTDGGNSFDEPIKVVEGVSTGTTVNNPTMIVGNDGTLHLLYCVEYGICTECNAAATSACTHGCGVFYTKSTNDGITWSEPVNISDSTAPDVRNVFAIGPGHGICLDDGTLLATVWYVRKDVGAALASHYTSEVCTIYSKDNGNSWQLGEEVPNPDNIYSPNETMLAKTSDGRVMLSIRTHHEGYRAVSWSDTGYSGWSDMKLDTALIDPTCMGSLYGYDVEGYPYMILSSNCNSTSGRRNITLRASLDDGDTWEKELLIDSGLAGYSDIAVDQNGTIYVLYEVEAGLTVNLARLTPAAFGIEKEIPSTGTQLEDEGSTNITINGEYVADEAEKVISVNISWEIPEFTYTVENEWDSDKFIEIPVEDGVWSSSPAIITIINNSNQGVVSKFSFAPKYDGITSKFTGDEAGNNVINELVLESAELNHDATEAKAYFFITGGELPNTHAAGASIGNITITISVN